jgi:hypothetical protein
MTTGGALTAQQEAFVTAYLANGCKQTEAARTAGYATPGTDGWRLTRNSAVRAAIRARQEAMMIGAGAIGIAVMKEIALDKAQPAPSRLQAAKWLAEADGYGLASRKTDTDDDDRPLSEMSLGELHALAAELQAQLDTASEGVIEGIAHEIVPNAPAPDPES